MRRISKRLFAVAPALLLMTLSLPIRAEVRMDESLKLEPGGKFVLDSDAGSVELSGGSRTGAHVLVTSEYDDLKEKFDFKFEENPGEVRVIVRKKGTTGWLSGWFGTTHAPSFKIEVPSKTDLQIKTGGGHLEVSAIRGDSDLRTSGGHIRVSDLEGKLTAETSGGHISLRDIVGDANIETSGGHIEVKSLKGSLKSHTSGGHVDLRDVS